MSVKFIPIQCPQCGANLSVESYREFAFCQYCGTKVMINNDNEHIYRTIDEAAMKQAETDRIVRLRELEIREQEAKRKRIYALIPYAVALAFILVGALICIFDSESGGMAMILGFDIALFAFAFTLVKNKKNKNDASSD